MEANCHIHMVLDGVDWKSSIARGIQDSFIRSVLQKYANQGCRYLRDGGDRWGVGARARELAGEYGITYRTGLSPLCKAGCYGSFIGTCWNNWKDYALLVKNHRREGADFIKIMISGLMDFHQFGILTQPGLPSDEIRELVDIAHQEGMAVMAHCNGGDTALAAADAGVDSIEHGAYLHQEALAAMVENRVVWVPTVSTVGNLLGKGRYEDSTITAILENLLENIRRFSSLGGLIAPGDDAGAWAVPHGCDTEPGWLEQAGVTLQAQSHAAQVIADTFIVK